MDADREIAQGADWEPSGDPVADRATAMRVAAGVLGPQCQQYREGLEREWDDPAAAAREASRVFGERMREIGQAYDAADRDDDEVDAGVDDDHRRHLGMGMA